ncbi:MAG: hypothetical protein Q9160_003296 [Pyrenula sp. 1 TL-2023]
MAQSTCTEGSESRKKQLRGVVGHGAYGYGESSSFYKCAITVSTVFNAEQTEHKVGDGIARIAAASIGLQGGKSDHDKGWRQSQFYPFGSTWDIHFKTPDEIGANMAEFALISIATMASKNPSVQIAGSLPHLGKQLDIEWAAALVLLLGIAGVHLVLFLLAIYANRWNEKQLLGQHERPIA